MKTKWYYSALISLFAVFLTLKILDGVIVFSSMYGDLVGGGALTEITARNLGVYLAVSLPQLVLMAGGFTAQFFLWKRGIYQPAKLIGALKYVLLPACYVFNVRWLIGNAHLIMLIIPLIVFIAVGAVAEVLLLSREERLFKPPVAA